MAILYSFRRCPFAIRARLALMMAVVEVEHREVSLREKPPSLIAFSAKGTVPVLIDGQLVIEESLEIMKWTLEQTYWANRYIDYGMIEENDTSFKLSLDKYKYPERFPEQSQTEYRDDAMVFLTQLNVKIAANTGVDRTGFLAGENFGFEDIAIFPFVRQFANVDRAWFDTIALAKVKKVLSILETSPLFKRTMAKYPTWQSGEETVFFPQEENLVGCEAQIQKFLSILSHSELVVSAGLARSFENAPPKNLNILLIRLFRDLGLSTESQTETLTSLKTQALEFFNIQASSI